MKIIGGKKDFYDYLVSYYGYDDHKKIYAFLGWLKDNPEPPNNQTNKEKIVANGFDTRTSFRPKIK